MLEICIPARLEAPFIEDAVKKLVRSLASWTNDWKISVVENGPSDGTKHIIDTLNDPRIKCIRSEQAGKGAAIRLAALQSTADLFGFIDADLSADPDAIFEMARLISSNQASCVIASRLLESKTTNRSWARTLSSRIFNLLAKLFLDLDVADAQCGLKLMDARSRAILAECQETGWFLDIEFLARLRQDKIQIKELPVPWLEFRYPKRKSQINHVQDGLAAVRAMSRIRKRLKYDELQNHA